MCVYVCMCVLCVLCVCCVCGVWCVVCVCVCVYLCVRPESKPGSAEVSIFKFLSRDAF